MKISRTILFLGFAAIASVLPAQAAEVAHFLMERQMAEDRQAAQARPKVTDYNPTASMRAARMRPGAPKPQPVQQPKVEEVKAPEAQPAAPQEDFSPFSSLRNFVYKYGSMTIQAAQSALMMAAYNPEEEIDMEEVACESLKPALLTLPADIIREGGKKISKATIGDDIVSPFSDTIGQVTAQSIVAAYDPEVPAVTKRDVGESVATDLLYALPKYTLTCALKEGLGWSLQYPYKRTLDTWTGVFHSFVGDMIEGLAKRIITGCLRTFVVQEAAKDLFGPKVAQAQAPALEETQEAADQVGGQEELVDQAA